MNRAGNDYTRRTPSPDIGRGIRAAPSPPTGGGGRKGRRKGRLGTLGEGCCGMADSALLAALIFGVDLAINEELAALLILVGNGAFATDGIPRPGHGAIARTERFQRLR